MDQQTNEMIKNEIDNNEVCLFMKGTPDAPQVWFLNGCIKYVKNFRCKI